jgi:hypothetical protein
MLEPSVMPIFLRGTERILIILVAALCIVLGYQLFRIVPTHRDSEGKLTLGELSVTLAKVGPGVFFALFGAVVLYQSVQSALTIEPTKPQENGEEPHASDPTETLSTYTKLTWFGTVKDDTDIDVWRPRAVGPIKILNCLAQKSSGSTIEKQRVEDAVHTAKVAILVDVWQPEWGQGDTIMRLRDGVVDADSPLGGIFYATDENC